MDAMKKRLVCKECGEREPAILSSMHEDYEVWVAVCKGCNHTAVIQPIKEGE